MVAILAALAVSVQQHLDGDQRTDLELQRFRAADQVVRIEGRVEGPLGIALEDQRAGQQPVRHGGPSDLDRRGAVADGPAREFVENGIGRLVA